MPTVPAQTIEDIQIPATDYTTLPITVSRYNGELVTPIYATGGNVYIAGVNYIAEYDAYISYIIASDNPNIGISGNLSLLPTTIANTYRILEFTYNNKTVWYSANTMANIWGSLPGHMAPYWLRANGAVGTPDVLAANVDAYLAWLMVYGDYEEETDPYSGQGEGSFGGDTIGIPGLPSLSAIGAGIFTLYAPTTGQMSALADFLWTNIDFSQNPNESTVNGAINKLSAIMNEIGEAIKRLVANPLHLVLGLSIIPSQGLSVSGAQPVRLGFWNTGVSMNVLSNQYFTVNCGSLSFDTICGNTFLDYAPYSKFSIYLPYCGTKQVDPNDFVGHNIGVVYHGDVVTGALTAYVTKDGSTMYQYSGSCALNLPLSSDNWGQTLSAAVNLAGSLGMAIASGGGAAGIASAALQSASNVASNPSQLSPAVAHSGAVAGGAGMLGVQVPYVIREAVRFPDTAGMNVISGYPSHKIQQLINLSGFTSVLDVHLTNISATGEEVSEIESLLKTGVIL